MWRLGGGCSRGGYRLSVWGAGAVWTPRHANRRSGKKVAPKVETACTTRPFRGFRDGVGTGGVLEEGGGGILSAPQLHLPLLGVPFRPIRQKNVCPRLTPPRRAAHTHTHTQTHARIKKRRAHALIRKDGATKKGRRRCANEGRTLVVRVIVRQRVCPGPKERAFPTRWFEYYERGGGITAAAAATTTKLPPAPLFWGSFEKEELSEQRAGRKYDALRLFIIITNNNTNSNSNSNSSKRQKPLPAAASPATRRQRPLPPATARARPAAPVEQDGEERPH